MVGRLLAHRPACAAVDDILAVAAEVGDVAQATASSAVTDAAVAFWTDIASFLVGAAVRLAITGASRLASGRFAIEATLGIAAATAIAGDSVGFVPTMGALHEVVVSGKARYLGASTMAAWQLARMQEAARTHRVVLAQAADLEQPYRTFDGRLDGCLKVLLDPSS